MKSLCTLFGFLRSAILASGLFLLPLATGCATTKIVHLNLDITTAPATFAAVAHTADAMGYQVTHLATAVNVRYDTQTWIYFGLSDHNYSMAIVVDNAVATEQISARIEEAKAKGEAIWARAVATRQQSSQPLLPTPSVSPAPSGSPAPSPTS